MRSSTPFIGSNEKVAEITIRCVILSIFLTMILAAANAYLALKLGILTSASIPAAIISMGILRFFKDSSVLENNAVQTAASAGEAVAGGIVYTIPALIIIGYWHKFDYLTNFLIAICGGVLGFLFSIPLRRTLVNDESLKFPEGRAIAEVLKTSSAKIGLVDIVLGSFIGGILEFLQVGIKFLASSWRYWFGFKKSIFCIGAGFSATMLGAGFLVGFDMSCSIFIGAILSWAVSLPIVSQFFPGYLMTDIASNAGPLLWNSQLQYLGIGSMLFAGVWTFIKLLKPLKNSMLKSYYSSKESKDRGSKLSRVDFDIPLKFICTGIFIMTVVLYIFFNYILPVNEVGLGKDYNFIVVFSAVLYVLIIGFLFSVITAYFSGMVGVTASPGSSVVIAGILFAAWLLISLMTSVLPLPFSDNQIAAAEAIVIVIASIVTGIGAIANDNTQDLKVGHILGATPWKQQIMLLLGVVVSACVIPPVMQILFDVYGIAGVIPHSDMDISQSLPAPTAALLAAITSAVFKNNLPWLMMSIGGLIIFAVISFNYLFKFERFIRIYILGVAIGMYLPITSSIPLFVGGMIAFLVKRNLFRRNLSKNEIENSNQVGMRIACGLVAGSALVDVVLAIPFSILHSPDALRLFSSSWENSYGVIFSITVSVGLGFWIIKRCGRRI
ncbi:MAG: oligopeptide transporter, OPT family [Legionellales bacterium RIFCSPHIGHO2_12_FULL_35_11]|nr:MAG: oligopeptide transporter, OPT family [Legionellales bacterium RIFCSPHIGHO2_12_FULL_35_11]